MRPDEAPATLPLWREGSGWLFALLALAAIAGVLYASAPGSGGKDARSRQHPVAPPAEVVPEVAPMELAPVTVEDARTANARVPLIAKHSQPARPFVQPGDPSTRDRARACMAAATLSPAGTASNTHLDVGTVCSNRRR